MPQNSLGDKLGARAAGILGYRHAKPSGHAAFGGFCDYVGGVLGLPAVTVELGKGKNPLPLSDEQGISERVKKLLILLPTSI